MQTVSVIIPIYNQQDNIESCISSLKKQSMPFRQLEILLINDGSTDNSGAICQKLSKKFENVVYLEQENKGVSAARNTGIRHATGKYIFYLDADDELSRDTIKQVTKFFDSVYDETDLVTYPLDTLFDGKILERHFRYRFLTESGIYDLHKEAFIGQTTMNIAVKNRFENNIFFNEQQSFSEDQLYCCEVLRVKLKMGYCAKGSYLYHRDPTSSSGQLSGSCFIFEQCMSMFEKIFSWYSDDVPLSFQGLYVNDIYWKLISNILLPYHYEKAEYDKAIERIRSLLSRCRNEAIWNHPHMDFFEKYYILRLKGQGTLQCKTTADTFRLYDGDKCLVVQDSMEMVITKVRIDGKIIKINGFVKSVFFQFYDSMPTLLAVENGGRLTRKLNVLPSSHNYYQSLEQTQRFWATEYSFNAEEVSDVHFKVELMGHWFPVHYYFMPLTPFSHNLKEYTYTTEQVKLLIDSENHIKAELIPQKEEQHIWLYYDCQGVPKDNGMLQFLHDIQKSDGIIRYYVVSDPAQADYLGAVKKHTVSFGSSEHKKLFLAADKIITAYIENNNVIPFEPNEYEKYANNFHFEVVYLQHGVLHIKMPWKYTPEKCLADRIVVSTEQESQLWIGNGYNEDALIKTCMPRFELLNQSSQKQKKILYAPSWRAYLVGANIRGKWQSREKVLLNSTYFKGVNEFLSSPALSELLNKHGYKLEVKLHPIFAQYKNLFEINSDCIDFVDSVDDESVYSVFITDFSSYLYNFRYLDRPILSFIPDITEFKAGMNGYRELNWNLDFIDSVSTDAQKATSQLGDILEGNVPCTLAADFYNSQSITERIYSELIP